MKKLIFVVLAAIVFCAANGSVKAQASNRLSISLTDGRKLITRNINKNLLLRIVKDSSVSQKHFCWLVEVVSKPYHRNSRNLIYTNQAGVTADRSQFCAWQVAEQYFPNDRSFEVRGFPYRINIALVNPQTKGSESNAGFTSGLLKISWNRK